MAQTRPWEGSHRISRSDPFGMVFGLVKRLLVRLGRVREVFGPEEVRRDPVRGDLGDERELEGEGTAAAKQESKKNARRQLKS